MFELMLVTAKGLEHVETYDSTSAAIQDMLQHWNEEDGAFTMVVCMDNDITCTLLRGLDEPEMALVVWPSGNIERYRCEYILNEDGEYERTEITDLG